MRALGCLLVMLACALPAGSASAAETRHSLQGGCFSLAGVAGAEQVRFQATTLGRYLLYLPDGRFLAASEDGAAPADEPSPAADWNVEPAGGDTFALTAEGLALQAKLTPAQGCAVYPEAELNATGRPAKGETPFVEVGGLVEGHMHWMTYEYIGGRFHCGRPWHAYGIPYALYDCSEIEGPQGMGAPVQNALNYGNPAQPHDTTGWPKFTEWGASNLTYEGTYWKWVERAWLGGLRLMVMGVNENRELCQLMANRVTDCNEMNTMRRGFAAIKELQRYVDAQAGGPGKGFMQIVTDPFMAREVINSGRMAVILEIETSEPFDCRGWEQPTCDRAQVDRQLDEMYAMGVRSSLLLNKFDNPLTGVRFDSGEFGMVINAGNRNSAGTFWSARTCTGKEADNEIFTGYGEGSAAFDTILTGLGTPRGTAPFYPPAPHCNTRGLTELGRHVVRRMMDLKMIVNPDHMSQAAVDDTLTLLESKDYSGVISPHGWMDPGNYPRLWKLGGIVFTGHSAADAYVKEWKKYRPAETPYKFGWGYGADLGGLSQQPRAPEGESIKYPFKSYDGSVSLERQKSGERTFDYTKEGVAHYGLYADWFADLNRIGGEQLARDMWAGAEHYLQMWERAHGIEQADCSPASARLSVRGLGGVRLGDDWQTVLRHAGQPQQRTRAWSWCVAGRRNARAADVAVFSEGGRVELIGSTARGRSAGGVRVSQRGTSLLRQRGVRVAQKGRTLLRQRGSRVWVYEVRGGRITAVAVTTRRLARDKKALRTAMALLRRAKATQVKRVYKPSQAEIESQGKLTGRALAATGNRREDARLQVLCRLQAQRA